MALRPSPVTDRHSTAPGAAASIHPETRITNGVQWSSGTWSAAAVYAATFVDRGQIWELSSKLVGMTGYGANGNGPGGSYSEADFNVLMVVSLNIPDETLVALKLSPDAAEREIVLAAAIKLFEVGRLPSGAAALLAGLPKPVFMTQLADVAPAFSRLAKRRPMAV